MEILWEPISLGLGLGRSVQYHSLSGKDRKSQASPCGWWFISIIFSRVVPWLGFWLIYFCQEHTLLFSILLKEYKKIDILCLHICFYINREIVGLIFSPKKFLNLSASPITCKGSVKILPTQQICSGKTLKYSERQDQN